MCIRVPTKYAKFKAGNGDGRDANSLMRNENIRRGNFIVAKKTRAGTFEFYKYRDVRTFHDAYHDLPVRERRFYVVWTKQYRYLYLDIDYKRTQQEHKSVDDVCIKNCITKLNEFMARYRHQATGKNYMEEWYIWNASRVDKFSLHIINPSFILKVDKLKQMMIQFGLCIKQSGMFPVGLTIDPNVYTSSYQLFRLPMSRGGDVRSILTLTGRTTTLRRQLILHDMNSIDANYTEDVKVTHHVASTKSSHVKHLYRHVPPTTSVQPVCDAVVTADHANIQKASVFGATWKLSTPWSRSRYRRQYKITHHICPIAHRMHKKNEGYVHCCTLKTNDDVNVEYITYQCMDASCVACIFRLSCDAELTQPWIFDDNDSGVAVDRVMMQSVECLIRKLQDHEQINQLDATNKCSVLQTRKIRHVPGFHTFFSQHIKHRDCATPSLIVKYLPADKENGAYVRCLKCEICYTTDGEVLYRNGVNC